MSVVPADRQQQSQNLSDRVVVSEDGKDGKDAKDAKEENDAVARVHGDPSNANSIANSYDYDNDNDNGSGGDGGNGYADGDGDIDDDQQSLADMSEMEDEADTMVGVSIGRAQNKIKAEARRTPAVEKNRMFERNNPEGGVVNASGRYDTVSGDDPDDAAAASASASNANAEDYDTNGLYLPGLTSEPESLEREDTDDQKQTVPDRDERGRGASRTAPRTSLGKGYQKFSKDAIAAAAAGGGGGGEGGPRRSSFTRSILKNLPRDPSPSFNNLKRFLPSPLSGRSRSLNGKMPKSKKQTQDQGEEKDAPTKRDRRFTWMNNTSTNSAVEKQDSPPPSSATTTTTTTTATQGPDSRRPSSPSSSSGSSNRGKIHVPGTGATLKRTASNRSLYLTRSYSSSLDGRDRYENVHSQVNIRFKAIKDTLHDSGKELLSRAPTHLPDFLPDFHFGDNNNNNNNNNSSNSHQQQSLDDITDFGREAQTEKYDTDDTRPRPSSSDQYPVLTEALSGLTGDVVVMGGYRGSVLRSAKPPHRQLWIPVVKAGLNLRKVNLEVGLDPEDEEHMEETVIPGEVLSHVGPVDVCRKLIKRLQKCENTAKGDLRVWEYGYDWRLSPRLLADRLVSYLQGLPCNAPSVAPEKRGAYVIAHSLGGLIVRHAVNQRPELFAGVLYAGVPQHCVNILGPLRNGEDVLLNSRVLTAQANFTFRTSFALLPESGLCFIDKRTKQLYPVDFFSAQTWDEYRLSPVIKPALPPMTAKHFIGNIPLIGKRIAAAATTGGSGSSGGGRDGSTEDNSDSSEEKENSTSSATPAAPSRSNTRNETSGGAVTGGATAEGTAGGTMPMSANAHGIIGPSTSALRIPPTTKAATVSTIPRKKAMEYLQRTLSEVLQFKKELTFNPSHQSKNKYPPFAVLHGKTIPTVYGARVWSREHIKYQDSFDDLAFAAGDGVVLASASMLPPGYRIIKGGLVKSDRGHVSLLGDLDPVGQCLSALLRGRREGVGLGPSYS